MANKRAAAAGCLSGVFDFFLIYLFFEALTLTFVMMIKILQGTNHSGQPMVDGRSGRAGLAWLLVLLFLVIGSHTGSFDLLLALWAARHR